MMEIKGCNCLGSARLSFNIDSNFRGVSENEFGNINARFDGLTSKLKALGLYINMNCKKKKGMHRG